MDLKTLKQLALGGLDAVLGVGLAIAVYLGALATLPVWATLLILAGVGALAAFGFVGLVRVTRDQPIFDRKLFVYMAGGAVMLPIAYGSMALGAVAGPVLAGSSAADTGAADVMGGLAGAGLAVPAATFGDEVVERSIERVFPEKATTTPSPHASRDLANRALGDDDADQSAPAATESGSEAPSPSVGIIGRLNASEELGR
jgi:hypothetical protein